MIAEQSLRLKINEQFFALQAKNPAYSLRAYAKKLGVSASALSEFRNGKRRLSLEMAERIMEQMDLAPSEKAEIIASFSKKEAADMSDFFSIRDDQFYLISDWYHFALLSLLKTKKLQYCSDWLGKRLGVKKREILAAIDRLVRLELVKKDTKGRLQRTNAAIATTDYVPSNTIKKVHQQTLELAQKSIYEVDMELRDLVSMTMAIDPEKIPEARERIRKFRNELSDFLESGEPKEVYSLSIQLFPLSKKLD